MTGSVGWLGELPLDPERPHLRLGLKTIPESTWLLPDGQRAPELVLKDHLLAERRPDVVAVAAVGRPTDSAQAETLALVTAWLRRHEPALAPSDDVSGSADHRHDSARADDAGHRARDLEAAARLVQEDLCLMAVGDGPPVLVAAVVCFPSHWRLAEKIGRPMVAIHRPVPDYDEDLGHRPDRVLEHLADDRIVSRRNWSIHDGGELFAPVAPAEQGLDAHEVPDRLWLRSERQTLRRLPTGDHVLFTIRVQQVPLRELRQRTDIAQRLAAAIRSEAPERLDRFAGIRIAPLLEWLDGCSGCAGPSGPARRP